MTLGFSSFSNIIDGRAKPTKLTRHGVNPATQENLWPSPLSTLEDVDAAVDAATRAKTAWAGVPWEDRQKLVSDLADALCNHAKEFAMLLTTEQGKPVGTCAEVLERSDVADHPRLAISSGKRGFPSCANASRVCQASSTGQCR